MEDEFQFLCCEKCHAEVQSPKLLPCLHNLCSQCLEENQPVGLCAVCRVPHLQRPGASESQENVFFANLQAKLLLYQKVTGSGDSVCDNCKKEAEFWCSSCEEFLCTSCFQTHQRYLKRESHEAQPLKDLKTESCQEFLSTVRKPSTMFCSNTGHQNQMLSLYCPWCEQAMCTICALLDSKHMGQHCDIRQEIQHRQEELQDMSVELQEKKDVCDGIYRSLEEQVKNMETLRNEARELIQQKVDEMVLMLQEKGERFLAEVDAHHTHRAQDVKKQLLAMEGVVKRITSSQQLVQKMQLYASGQEVLEMHPFLKASLELLQRKPLPPVDFGTEVISFTDTKAQLQALLNRVTQEEKEVVPTKLPTDASEGLLGKSPVKRKHVQEERNIQSHPKMIKIEPSTDKEWEEPGRESCSRWLDQPGISLGSVGGGLVAGGPGSLREKHASSMRNLSSEEESTDDDDDDEEEEEEKMNSDLPLDINGESPGSQNDPEMYPFSKCEDDSVPGTVVFFDLKRLSGNALHLYAVSEATSFSVVFSFSLEHTKGTLCEVGLDMFLNYLSTILRPILVGYKLWSMELPALFDALWKINREKQFEDSIFGFLDALPLIKEKYPDISNYTLKNLDDIYLCGELDLTKAIDCAKTLKDLCTVLEINPMTPKRHVIGCSSLRCYSSLQPLLWEKVLFKSSVKTLALHNISLSDLQSVYQNDPENGLKKLGRYLNARLQPGEKKVQKLSKICTYFQHLPSGRLASFTSKIH